MKLIFHIGIEKTGTTSAQHWLADNREALARQGVVYSQSLGRVNNRKISLWAIDPSRPDQGFLQFRLLSKADRERFRAELPGIFAAEVNAARESGARAFVISNETCHSRLQTQAEVARAHEFLAPHFDQIEVVCVLRPQVDVAVSLASTMARVRNKVTGRFFDKVVPDNPYYDYAGLVDRWSRAFGAENLSLHGFARLPSIASLLVDRFGLNTAELIPQSRQNEAIDVGTMALVNALDVPLFLKNGQRNPFGELFIDKLACHERLQIGEDLAREIQARFQASNAALLASRGDIGAGDLTPDWSRYRGEANLDRLNRDGGFGGQLDELVWVFHQRIALETIRTRIAECERALARERMQNARKFADRAMALADLLEGSRHFPDELAAIRAQLAAIAGRLPPEGRAARRGKAAKD